MALKQDEKPNLARFGIIEYANGVRVITPHRLVTIAIEDDTHIALKMELTRLGLPLIPNASTMLQFMLDYGLTEKVFKVYPAVGRASVIRKIRGG